MIIPLPVPVHRDLHAEVKPPIVPNRHLADTLVHHLNTLNPINAFSGVLSLLDVIVEQDNSMSEQAYQLAYNFREQAEVMSVIYPIN